MMPPSERAGPHDDQNDSGNGNKREEVQSPHRLLECAQVIRHHQFLRLVRHFLVQILHGCTETYCTTPTCLSSSKRQTSRPFRAPTQLTARALAYYLASQDNPHRALCPHPLNSDPDDMVLDDGSEGILTWRAHQQISSPLKATWSQVDAHHLDERVLRLRDDIYQRRQYKKDYKSLGQNIYDTIAVISSYSKHMPSPRTLFDIIRSPEVIPPSPLDGSLETSHAPKKDRGTPPANAPSRQSSQYASSIPTREDRPIESSRSSSERSSRLHVFSHLTCSLLTKMKEENYDHRDDHEADSPSTYIVDFESHRRHRPVRPFVNRSLFFTLSDPESLLKSFRDGSSSDYHDSPLPHLDAYLLSNAFSDWDRRNGALIFDSLYIALDALFRPPPEIDTQKSPRLRPASKMANPDRADSIVSSASSRYLSNEEAAHIVMICIHALTALVYKGWPATWAEVRVFRGWGVVIPGSSPETDHTESFNRPWLRIVDELEYEPAIRLANRLLSGIGIRMCFEHILTSLDHHEDPDTSAGPSLRVDGLLEILVKHLIVVERVALAKKARLKVDAPPEEDPGWTVTSTWMEWLRTIIVKKFDGNAEVNKWGSTGAALLVLEKLYAESSALNLRKNMFHIPYLNKRMNAAEVPNKFLSWEDQPNTLHLLRLPFLFKDNYIVAYFRTINFTIMSNQFLQATRSTELRNRFDSFISAARMQQVDELLQVTADEVLQLKVTRENQLEQTLDQLWGQEKRMLLKPLKVRLGTSEGEYGLDQGGVTYEFFRLVLKEAFQPQTGMFLVDDQTGMIWFHPATFEPTWKYQMLGVIFSLAVYNGITLPVTFPLALYTSLLQPDLSRMNIDDCATDFIRDGWPTLAKSFDDMLAFDGDVSETYMRDYTFSYEAYGRHVDIDMQTACSVEPTASNTPLVTNANRHQFVKDYITWLTRTSIKPQLDAFREGFRTCLHPASLRLFNPESLRSLVEGNPVISVQLLRKHTRYEGYSDTDPIMLDFWSVVETYSQKELRHLLEFVTSSERVPITGYESMNFTIAHAGGDTELLPTSSTCFRKLSLPAYSGRERMREKLRIALAHSEGFGVV
ncbi:unnamed protein product [Periconia digitata]|uniref:HECT-type E3 ubiquitin transferase n=1 Tax=Periconia digitata TaxID=1303443 RepID=A0A9W4U8Y2_9PLEO|nr:unnamed protein product [Periconia digitata]